MNLEKENNLQRRRVRAVDTSPTTSLSSLEVSSNKPKETTIFSPVKEAAKLLIASATFGVLVGGVAVSFVLKEGGEDEKRLPEGVVPVGETEPQRAEREMKKYQTELALARLKQIADDQKKVREAESQSDQPEEPESEPTKGKHKKRPRHKRRRR